MKTRTLIEVEAARESAVTVAKAEASGPAAFSALRRDALLHLVASALGVAFVAAVLVVVTPLPPAYLPAAMAVWSLAAAWIWHTLPAHAPHARFGPANRVTLARLCGVVLVAATLVATPEPVVWQAWLLIVVTTLAALADAVDGALARRSGLASDFGARFDMETDALLILVLSLLLLQFGKAPVWVIVAGSMRYAFVAAIGVWPWLGRPLFASVRRKTVCVVQIIVLIVALGPVIPVVWSTAISAAGLLMLSASFAVDIAWLARRRHLPLNEGDRR